MKPQPYGCPTPYGHNPQTRSIYGYSMQKAYYQHRQLMVQSNEIHSTWRIERRYNKDHAKMVPNKSQKEKERLGLWYPMRRPREQRVPRFLQYTPLNTNHDHTPRKVSTT